MTKIVIVTKQGMILKFPANCVRTCNRFMRGVKAIKLAEGDMVISAFTVEENDE